MAKYATIAVGYSRMLFQGHQNKCYLLLPYLPLWLDFGIYYHHRHRH